MDLRPMTYDEMCQMELMHTGSNCGVLGGDIHHHHASINPLNSATDSVTGVGQTSQTAAATSQCQNENVNSMNTTTATMLPIMVIPTSMMPPGTHLITATPAAMAAAAAASNTATPLNETDFSNDLQRQQQFSLSKATSAAATAQPTHFYQLQPTHILATAAPTNTEFTLGSAPTTALFLQPTSQLAASNTSTANMQSEQLPHNIQQQPLTQQQIPQQCVNILYAGTLTKTPHTQTQMQLSAATTPLTRAALECSTLPRNFQATSLNAASQDESDFEGSECGASVSTTTCIPHFRFGGCGVILQPAQNFNQQQHQHQQPQQHAGEPQVIGCASLSHMMGSFASAAGDAMHTGSRNLAGTLGRNRRSQSTSVTATVDGIATQTPKRVSFKGVDMPSSMPPPSAEELQMLDAGNHHGPNMDAFNNCSYMNFDNFMDYQVSERQHNQCG